MAYKTYEVAVIGGGVTGSAIAYHLAKAGVKVVLVEKGDICSGASATNPGFCVLTYREDPVVMELALQQRREWDDLSQELGVNLEYECTGGLIPISNQQELEVLAGLVQNCHNWGLKQVEIVKSDRAVEQERALDPTKIIAAVYCPWEGRINPFKLTLSLADRARLLGAHIMTGAEVTGMEVARGNVKTIHTLQGDIKADVIFCAAGAWTRKVLSLAGASLPVEYERGEAMVSIASPPTIRGMVTDGSFFVREKEKPPMVAGACLAQTKSGNIVLAQATTQIKNHDRSSTYAGPIAVAKKVLYYFPKLSDLEILRMWGGIVAYTPDRQPLFGFLPNPKNLFVVVGFHSAIGIAPILGRIVKDVYLKGKTQYDFAAYSPLRFLQ
jgi:sarcosine oxidase subunit beta